MLPASACTVTGRTRIPGTTSSKQSHPACISESTSHSVQQHVASLGSCSHPPEVSAFVIFAGCVPCILKTGKLA